MIDPKDPIPSIPSYNGVDYMYAARVQEALAAEIQQELDQADVRGSVHFFVHARIGKAAEEILLLAGEVGADLIIVGSKGMSGLERGERNLTLKSLERIADKLNLDPLELLSRS